MYFILINKVFKPSTLGKNEDLREWVNARMWFNMVDAQYHESITHLGNVFPKRILLEDCYRIFH